MTVAFGTKISGDDTYAQQEPCLRSAKVSGPQTLASWIWPENGANKVLMNGPCKGSSIMPPIGSTKNEALMQPQHARGFITLLLNNAQRLSVRATEKKLSRYLTPREIYRQFPTLEQKLVTDEQKEAMEQCASEFFKTHAGVSWMDEIDAWEDWVLRNYHEPLPVLKTTKSIWED